MSALLANREIKSNGKTPWTTKVIKVVFGSDEMHQWREHLDLLATSASSGAGRSCLCLSTIVVPRDPKPFDLVELLKDITPVLSNLAVTAASLAVIGGAGSN